jgi:hypothetical protein
MARQATVSERRLKSKCGLRSVTELTKDQYRGDAEERERARHGGGETE